MARGWNQRRAANPEGVIRKHHGDRLIVVFTVLLMFIGLLLIYAIGPQRANLMNSVFGFEYSEGYFFWKQLLSITLAIVAFWVASLVPYGLILKHSTKLLWLGFIACALLAIGGWTGIVEGTNGAVRWFDLGPLGSVQPAEILKLGVLMYLAVFIAVRAKEGKINELKETLFPVAAIAGFALLFVIVIQKDLGTGISLTAIVATMLFVAGINRKIIFGLVGLLLVAGLLLIFTSPHRIERVMTYLQGDDTTTQDADAYHIQHAKIAIGSGGLFGVGIGDSVQASGYLPEAINDSIFAIIGETFGFIGTVALLALFVALLMRLLGVMDHMVDLRLKLLAAGVFGWLGAHVILNIAAMIGIFPLTGITLPLLSYGGTSMIFIAAALGLVFQLSKYTVHSSRIKEATDENSRRGRGSGGHVTPVVAVLKELRAEHPKIELKFWCDVHFASQAKSIVGGFDDTIPVETIASGKLRRYHHLTLWQHITWPSLMWQNGLDFFKVLGGFFQSTWKLLFWRPDVIFTKGGFVCLPVGMAARVLHIPLVIHDSDAHPGLTNQILSRWATKIATGAPLEYYNYPKSKTQYIGIPVNKAFREFSKEEQLAAKKRWGVYPNKPLLVVTGGGLGATRLNNTTLEVLDTLQQIVSVILVSGTGPYDKLRARYPEDTKNFQLHSFVSNMHELLGAADIVVTRAGATTILELAALRKPTILVPNAALTGGHQLKNAAVYGEAQVAIVLDEDETVENPTLLVNAVNAYLNDPKTTQTMAKRFGKFAKPNAARDMAKLILSAAK